MPEAAMLTETETGAEAEAEASTSRRRQTNKHIKMFNFSK